MSDTAPALVQDRSPAKCLAAVVLAAVVLAAVFLTAGVLKARDVAGFSHDIQNYRIFAHPVAVGLAYFVPALELVAGVAVLVPRWRRAGALVLAVLLAAFALLLAVSWARGLDISCGCFGAGGGSANYPLLLVRDLVFLLLAGWLVQARAPALPRTS